MDTEMFLKYNKEKIEELLNKPIKADLSNWYVADIQEMKANMSYLLHLIKEYNDYKSGVDMSIGCPKSKGDE